MLNPTYKIQMSKIDGSSSLIKDLNRGGPKTWHEDGFETKGSLMVEWVSELTFQDREFYYEQCMNWSVFLC